MLHQPHDTVMPLIDKVQLSFSGGGAIPCSSEFAQHLFPDVLPAAQHHMDIALGSNYRAMTAEDEATFFSQRCVHRNYQFDSPDETWAHMSTHIIQMHPSISMYSLGTLLLEFLTVCNALGNTSQQKLVQAALKQQFALRVVALHYGRGRRQDEPNDRSLEAHPATRGSDDHEKDAGTLPNQSSEKETAPWQAANVYQEGGHPKCPDVRSLEDVGPADAPTGESTEMSQPGPRVHPAHWLGRRRNLSRDGHPDSSMARGREDRSPTLEVGTLCHEDHQSTTEPIGPLQKRIRVVDPNGQCSSDLGDRRPAVLDMGLQDTEASLPTKQQPLKMAEVQSMMAELEKCSQDQSLVMKFHSLKKVTPDHQVQSSPWSLMISNRCHPVVFQHLMALLALHLATRPCPVETSGTSAIQSGGSAQEGEPSSLRQMVGGALKVVRVLLNPNVICYLNAVIQGVTWTSLGATCLDESLWNDGGKLLATMSRPSPFPLHLPKHSSFKDLWNSWCQQVNGAHQHDVREFLDFLLHQLGPKFWGGLSSPLWACNDNSAEGAAAKGARWMTVSFDTPQSEGTSLQHLINQWHDETGMKNGLMCQGRALALHLARYNGENSSQKTYACITLPHDNLVQVPHLVAETEAVDSDFQVKWIQYSIVGLTWHAGPDTATGHYRTILREHHRWMHHDDNKPPCSLELINEHLLQRITIIWMVLHSVVFV